MVVRTTSTSESIGFKSRLPITFRVTAKSNLTSSLNSVGSSIRRGLNSIVFRTIFQRERFRSGFLH